MTPDLRESSDQPIKSANQDLLGAETYAKQLAEYILTMDRNFTVGVYGQWGSGKTSFVHLVKASLVEKVHFIEFTAWPFRTSDELWRALILKIARYLYEESEDSWPPPSKPAVPLVKRWREFLNSTVFSPPEVTDAELTFASYDNFVAELDANLIGSIRKAPLGAFADDEQAALTVAKSVAATVATLSPFGEVLRLLIARDDQKDDRQTNAQTRSRIDSITKSKLLLHKLFEKKAGKKRVCVFVDDLDRCMPDVALDLLEAIQVFLSDPNCVFIVAADQELIGQGLKARFKDLVESAQLERDQEFYARKGREYFEKIIQFGVPVPEAGPNEGYRFIGANFPQWAASADLIIAAIGANPRRLKQYVGLLDYRYRVATSTPDGGGPMGGTPTAGLRSQLTAIWWRDHDFGTQLRQLIESNGFTIGPDWRRTGGLDASLRKNSLIRALMPSDEALSKVHTTVPGTILRFADLQPGQNSSLVTSDAPFQRIISTSLLGLPATTKGLITEDVARLSAVNGHSTSVLNALVALAATGDYSATMQEIERRFGDTSLWAADDARAFFSASPTTTQEELEQRRKLLTDEPLLSTIDREVVLAYGQQRPTAHQASLDFDPGEAVRTRTDLRIEAAADYAARRRFAKGDVLLHVWPELGVYLRFDRPKLLALEEAATAPDGGRTTEWSGRLQQDERLRRFLNLRPDFRELIPAEVTRVAAVAQQVTASTPAPMPQEARPAEGTAQPVQPQAPAQQPPVTPQSRATPSQQPASETATTDTATPSSSATSAPKKVEKLEISLPDQDTVFLRMEPTDLTRVFSASAWDVSGPIESWTAELPPETRLDPATREISDGQLQEIGQQLFASIFPGAIGDRMRGMLQKRLRLMVDESSGVESVSRVPWEILTPDIGSPGWEGRFHVIRYLRSQRSDTRPPSVSGVVRLLAVIPAGPSEGEAQHVLERLLHPAADRGLLRYSILGGSVTLEQLRDEVRNQRPNVFHFFGRAESAGKDEGAIVVSGESVVGAGSLAGFFTHSKNMASLAVLLGPETGRSQMGVQNSVAGRLAREGVPSVIGTLRPITARAALLFSQRFYSSLLENGDLERAVSEARKALAREKWDWSAFALFANTASIPRLPFHSTAVS